jgi:hypothetical protein
VRVREGRRPKLQPADTPLFGRLEPLMQRCWSGEAEERPDFNEIYEILTAFEGETRSSIPQAHREVRSHVLCSPLFPFSLSPPPPLSPSLSFSLSLFSSLSISLHISFSPLSSLCLYPRSVCPSPSPSLSRSVALALSLVFSSLILLPSVCVVLSSHVVRRRCVSIGLQSSEEETKGVTSSPKPARSRSMAIRRDDPDMLTPLLAAGTAGAASNSSSEGRVRRAGARRQIKPKPLGAIVAVEPGLWIGE